MGLGLTLPQIEHDIVAICKDFSWMELRELGFDLGLAFFVGGFVWGMILALASYFILRYLITNYRKRKKPLPSARF